MQAAPRSELFIGLMSGTSLDGVDAVLARFPASGAAMQVLAHQYAPFAPALRDELLALNSPGGDRRTAPGGAGRQCRRPQLRRSGRATARSEHPIRPGRSPRWAPTARPCATGPASSTAAGYTTQLLNGALLAEQSGIATICDPAQPRRRGGRPGRAAGTGLPPRPVRPSGARHRRAEHRWHQQRQPAGRRRFDAGFRLRPRQLP